MQRKFLYILLISYTFNDLWTWQRSSRLAPKFVVVAGQCVGMAVLWAGEMSKHLGFKNCSPWPPDMYETLQTMGINYQPQLAIRISEPSTVSAESMFGNMLENLPPSLRKKCWNEYSFLRGLGFLLKKTSHGSSMVESSRILMPPSTHLRGNHVVTGRSQGLLDGDGFLAHQAL